MSRLRLLACVAMVSVSAVAPVGAGPFRGDGLTLVWVTIRAYPGEGLWQACRRVYQRDVYMVQGRPGNRVRCRIDHSRIYHPGEVRQNFNVN